MEAWGILLCENDCLNQVSDVNKNFVQIYCIFLSRIFDVNLKISVVDDFTDLMIFMICCKEIVQLRV